MTNLKKIYVGYDTREDLAYQVCKFCIERNSSKVEVKPLKLTELRERKLYNRDHDQLGSTEFTFSRFLIPVLNKYEGWVLYCDSDILFLEDLDKLFELADDKYAVMCVQHNYTPKEKLKMDNKQQTIYPRKNWSSVVLWNCSHPSNKIITKNLINDPSITGKYLHRFSWLKDEEIGPLPHNWNWLVGWYMEPDDGKPKAIHYTEGGPWFEKYRFCEYHKIWKEYLHMMMNNEKEEA